MSRLLRADQLSSDIGTEPFTQSSDYCEAPEFLQHHSRKRRYVHDSTQQTQLPHQQPDITNDFRLQRQDFRDRYSRHGYPQLADPYELPNELVNSPVISPTRTQLQPQFLHPYPPQAAELQSNHRLQPESRDFRFPIDPDLQPIQEYLSNLSREQQYNQESSAPAMASDHVHPSADEPLSDEIPVPKRRRLSNTGSQTKTKPLKGDSERARKYHQRLHAINGIRTPAMTEAPTTYHTSNSTENPCPICNACHTKPCHLQSHFVFCAEKNGNPEGLCWNELLQYKRSSAAWQQREELRRLREDDGETVPAEILERDHKRTRLIDQLVRLSDEERSLVYEGVERALGRSGN